MRPLVLATAGHIDHGKTALVRALTGTDTDRLPEEKQRGITIDLGFANLEAGDASIAVVDVPGHEGFIRNMLAGATGMDAVMLVVAADEGIMPQTREHLAILDLLGVRAGVVAITKIDLVEPEWTELVVDDVRDLLAPTTLRGAPVMPVSARTASGLDALRAALGAQAALPKARPVEDLLRMPVDRVFTVRGTGTVVTGTVWSGTVRMDQEVTLGPAGRTARVRGIQVHGNAVPAARAGERAALALAGIERSALARGDTVLDVSGWPSARMLTIQARLIADSAWQLKNRQRVRVHLGTAEVLARVMLLDRETLPAGAAGWVQLRLEEPVIARAGDRIVLRSYSPVTTIGGGTVAEVATRKRSRLDAAVAHALRSIVDGPAPDAVAAALSLVGRAGATVEEIARAAPVTPGAVAGMLGTGGHSAVAIGSRYFAAEVVEDMVAAVARRVDELHARQPLRPHLDRAEVAGGFPGVPMELAERALNLAVERGLVESAGGTVAAAGRTPVLNARQSALKAEMYEALRSGGLTPPTATELGRRHGTVREVEQLLRLLEHEGAVRAVSPDLYIESGALAAAEQGVRTRFAGVGGLAAGDFRAALPVTRKHLIPLLEYFDRAGITMREGDLRRVASPSHDG